MSTITIYDLRPTGSELFSDSESYMKDLTEEEIDIQGGLTPFVAAFLAGALVMEYLHHH
ncbi:hypothetical protein [Coleofasciculus sp. F4-SAH-05]|uniref:hypothetical protein n=1 Tax=Coleofasciculus sp. F4-SAH-05 TaxID=3069525 RepID=UPI0032F2D5C4